MKIDTAKVENLLEKKNLNIVLDWFEKLPHEIQVGKIKRFIKIFDSAKPPKRDGLQKEKTFYEAKNIERLMWYTDNKDTEAWQVSFDKLAPLFPTPEQWLKYKDCKRQTSNFFEFSTDDFLKSNPSSPNFDKKALEQAINDLPLFDRYHKDQRAEEQYLTQAKALIELYPFRKDISSMFSAKKEEQSTRINNKEIIKRFIQETAESISQKGNAKYMEETIKLYLTCYVKYPELSRNDLSEKAAELTASQNIKNQLIDSIDKGARSGWEKKLDNKIERYTSLNALE